MVEVLAGSTVLLAVVFLTPIGLAAIVALNLRLLRRRARMSPVELARDNERFRALQ